ncbi:MAG: transcriptional regulator [Candidatus Thorarchaeota archaeon]
MLSKQKYLDNVRDVLDSSAREHATTFDNDYCFDSIVHEGFAKIAIKVSLTIDDVEPPTRAELSRICPFLRCTPLIIGERTRKRPLQDGVVHTRGSISAITLGTLRRMLEDKKFPLIVAKKGGIYVVVNGAKLKKAREALNFSRGDIANELGLSRRAIYEYERGSMSPTIDVAIQLEQLLETQLIEPLNLLEQDATPSIQDTSREAAETPTQLARKASEVFFRLGFDSTITHDTPFDMLTALQHQVILSYLKQRLERLDIDRLLFLAELADVLNEEPAIISSEKAKEEAIGGIPVIYLKELLEIKTPKEFIQLIRSRRGA